MLPIEVISSGDLFREVFNGIVTVLGSSTMHSALRIAAVFAVLGVLLHFMQGRDVTLFLKAFLLYFVVTVLLLGPKSRVQIIDLTDPTGIYEVDNVPIGLALPASVITQAGAALAKEFDSVFHLPDSETYTKTGMLFGAELLRQSLTFEMQDADARALLIRYIPDCVVGDMTLNGKYTLNALLHSPNPWALISAHASPVRGLFTRNSAGERQFETCQQVATTITQKLNQTTQAGGTTFSYYVRRIFGSDAVTKQQLFSALLAGANNYFTAAGQTASEILKNNVVNNAIRAGIRLNATQSNSNASLLSLADTTAFEKMRLSWAVGRDIAVHTLPLMNTVFLLLLFGVFPLIVLLGIQGRLGLAVLKHYVGSIIYLESWPILFAILNLVFTFYMKSRLGAIGPSGVTLSNSNYLANKHSDLAGMAGYCALAIPFIAMGLVKGLANTLSVAANYVGGSFHSVASSESSQAVSGNWAFNNMQMDNLSANKYDTNLMHRSGATSFQTAQGGMTMESADSTMIYTANLSHLPIAAQLGSAMQQTLQQSLHNSEQATRVATDNFNTSVSALSGELAQSGQQTGHSEGITHGNEFTEAGSLNQAIDNMQTLANDYALRHNVSQREAYSALIRTGMNYKGEAGVSTQFDSSHEIAGKLGSWATGLSAKGSVSGGVEGYHGTGHSTEQSDSGETGAGDSQESRISQAFRHNLDYLISHRHSVSEQRSDSVSASRLDQMASQYQQAENYNTQRSASLTASKQYADLLSKTHTDSASFTENLNQDFVDYVQHHTTDWKAKSILSGSTNPVVEAEREHLMDQFIHERVQQSFTSADVADKNVTSFYDTAKQNIEQKQAGIESDYQSSRKKIDAGAKVEPTTTVQQAVAEQAVQTRQQVAATEHQVKHAGESLPQHSQALKKQVQMQQAGVQSKVHRHKKNTATTDIDQLKRQAKKQLSGDE